MVIGITTSPTGMSGFLMWSIMSGGRIITEGGAGILSLGGRGYRMTRGDGVSPITEGGIGDGVSVGTGYP